MHTEISFRDSAMGTKLEKMENHFMLEMGKGLIGKYEIATRELCVCR